MLCPQFPSVSFPTGLVDSGVTQTPKYLIRSRKLQAMLCLLPNRPGGFWGHPDPQIPDQIKKTASNAEMFP